MNTKLLIGMYLFAIVAANLLVVRFGPSVVIFNAVVFIALDLCTRDRLHDAWSGKHLWRNMALLIGAGSVLSALLNWNAATIAVASFVAFAAAGAVDALVYHLLRKCSRLVRMNGSNVASAFVDSYLFLYLAFGIFPGFWGIVAGQYMAKVLGGVVWSWVLTRREWAGSGNVTAWAEAEGD